MNYSACRQTLRFLLIIGGTALFEGLRAGAGTFRLLLDLPAREDVGPIAFAEFSRATDLSTRGVVFYIVYGFGGALLTLAAWLWARRVRADRMVRRLLGAACICSLLVLILTTRAAPLMWQVGRSQDATVLRALLDRFTFWTELRIVLVDGSFVAVLSSLVALALKGASPQSSESLPGRHSSTVPE
jgi:hypothetical protein